MLRASRIGRCRAAGWGTAFATVIVALLALPANSLAAPGTITTVAGNGTAALSGDGGPATSASLNHPQGVVAAPGGGFYIADNFNHVVRKVDAAGNIERVAGTGAQGFSGDNGPATSAKLNFPRGLAVMSDGSLLIADTNNSRIRKINPFGVITTVAGGGAGGDGGLATAASLCFAGDVAVRADGSLLIADTCNHRVREVSASTGIITTVAGNGVGAFAGDGGPATAASLNQLQGVAVTPSGGFVIADKDNNRVREVSSTGTITTLAGNGATGGGGDGGPATSAELGFPQGIEVAGDGAVLIPDTNNHRVRRVTSDGKIATVAGTGSNGFSGDGGSPTSARLSQPYSVAELPGGHVLIAEHGNNRIRRVDAPLAPGATFVVNSTADTSDGACWPAPGNCTLREAINAANSNGDPSQSDTIAFAIGLGGLQTINVSALPAITEPVLIDGSTQPGYVEGGPPLIEITRPTVAGTGLDVWVPATIIRALAINHFSTAIELRPNARLSTVEASYLGTTPDGTMAKPNTLGIQINSADNTIGGPTAAQRNVISGNGAHGIVVADVPAANPGNNILGNYIGTNAAGTAALGNGDTGVQVLTHDTTVGPGNVISGNNTWGVDLTTAGSDTNVIKGNRIGTDAAGTAAIRNVHGGIDVADGSDNVIGGPAVADRNVISGNGVAPSSARHGILIQGDLASGNKVQGNFVGLGADGATDLGNGGSGVAVTNGRNTVGPGNVISGNVGEGVLLFFFQADNNIVTGNKIGTDASGLAAVANGGQGVAVVGGASNIIGGATAAERNVISGNGGNGVLIAPLGDHASGNFVIGNYIGLNASGNAPLGNVGNGVDVADDSNTIGFSLPGTGNVISGNGQAGVRLNAANNVVFANLVGTDATGESAVANAQGLNVTGSGNLIGGAAPAARNIISGNTKEGVLISGADATNNNVRGNRIGTDDDGQQAVGNGTTGVTLDGAGTNVIGGSSSGQGNLISGNASDGVRVTGSGGNNNSVTGNFVGTNAAGNAALGNGAGINLSNGGTAVGQNVISGNTGDGLRIVGSGADGNTVRGNKIGPDPSGNASVGNGVSGVFIAEGADSNVVGGTTAADRNVISSNGRPGDILGGGGIVVDTPGNDQSHLNRVLGNYIGVKANGRQPLGNEADGVLLNGSNNQVGGAAAGEGNVVSGNGDTGVRLSAGHNTVLGNRIGTDATGFRAAGNNTAGVAVTSGDNTIGDGTTGGRNVVSGNLNEGVWMFGAAVTGNRLRGNFVGTDAGGGQAVPNGTQGVYLINGAGNFIGGTSPGDGNVVSGNREYGVIIFGAGATGNGVKGNLVGTDATGGRGLGNGASGVLVQSATGNSVGGSSPGARNVISDNGDPGVYLYQASQNTIRGNYIGTDVGGNQPLGNVYGVYVTSSNDATVGGTGAGEGNVIGDTANEGIGVDGTSNHATIQGNSIGVGTGGADVGGKAAGVRVESADGTSHTLGGTAPGAANTIGFNDGPGVEVTAHPISLSARGNSIYSNSGLGIDLGAAGVTANDALDADTGANDLQNYPVLTVATSGGGATTVRGTLGSKANQTYSVDFYSDAACDPSGNGEGRTYLGSADVTTDANGYAAIAETLSADVPVGQVVTATATDASGNTSEFSACRSVAGVPAASVGDVTVPEAGGNATVPVTLSAPSADTVTVDYATTDGTAQAGSDYGAVSGTLTFAPGETTKDVTVPVTADNLDETDETLTVDLSNPDKATIADAHGDVTITDDDAAPALSIADTSVTEGTGGTSEATFTVSLSAPSGKTVKVDAVTADGSAVAPGDYTARHVALTFAPGDTSRTVTVPVTTDARDETDETFTVALAGEANATVARREAVGTIQDDDQPPAFSVSDVRVAEDTGTDVDAVFTVSLSEPSGRPTSVDFATTDGTAVAGSDYTATQTRVTFAPGETSKAVPVRVTGDSVHEPEETFGARLSAPADAVVADGEGVATVVDDDPAPVPPAQQPEQRDSSAPGFTLDGVPRRLSRADLLHDGLALILDPDEAVSFDAQLTARPRMLRGARSGDVVIARKNLPLAAGKRTTKLRVLRKLRRRFSHQRVELRLTILAVDAAGNRTRVTRPVFVR